MFNKISKSKIFETLFFCIKIDRLMHPLHRPSCKSANWTKYAIPPSSNVCWNTQANIRAKSCVLQEFLGKNIREKKTNKYDVVLTGQSVLSHCVCQLDQLHVGTLSLVREWSLRGLRGYHHHHTPHILLSSSKPLPIWLEHLIEQGDPEPKKRSERLSLSPQHTFSKLFPAQLEPFLE